VSLLSGIPKLVNVGVASFVEAASAAGAEVVDLDWRPVEGGDPKLAWLLANLMGDGSLADASGTRIDRANAQAIERILAARPVLVDIALQAREIWPDLDAKILLHAGAPLPWRKMCGPMQGAAIGALLYEGWAKSPEEAEAQLARGDIRFESCHDRGAVGPMAGIISASMPLFVVRNEARGNLAYTNMSEGIGRVLRFGANGPDVIERLKWIEKTLAPTLKAAVAAQPGGINLKSIQAQALLMGDEVHSRNTAASSLFYRAVAGPLMKSDLQRRPISETLDFIDANWQFFLNLSMASAKATMDAAVGVAGSSIVTAMARNGVTVAIRVAGLGRRWFEAPADQPIGLYFPGFKAEDANPDLGDSAITETAGFGGFSLAASPALVQLVGGTPAEARAKCIEMYEITCAKNPTHSIPALDFAGAPTGIDIRKVVDTGIRPVITTGLAHRQAGIGQVGVGIVRAPMACFTAALEALAAEMGVA